jgi:DNA-binding CsgD family transcriptional regulator
MARIVELSAHEQDVKDELLAELFGSLDLSDVLGKAHGLLSHLVPADHGALCVSRPEGASAYDWVVAEMPGAFFAEYASMVPHDFVRAAVAESPNWVLRDSEMLSRREIEESFLYRHCRTIGMKVEHVMAIMLSEKDSPWHGGLILYRDQHVPFSDREQAILQHLSRYFTAAVRNCKKFGEVERRGSLLDTLLSTRSFEGVVFQKNGKEFVRTAGLSKLLTKWFHATELGSNGLPAIMTERLVFALHSSRSVSLPKPWWREGHTVSPALSHLELRVSVMPLPEINGAFAVTMEEVPQLVPIPPAWHDILTASEIRTVERVCWDNALIASDLEISDQTVKKHISRSFDKLGVSSRGALIHAAWRLCSSVSMAENMPR